MTFIWKNREIKSISDLLNEIDLISSPEEAKEFLNEYQNVNPSAKDDIGWLLGENPSPSNKEKILNWFECVHPIFGNKSLSTEELLSLGISVGQAAKAGQLKKFLEYLKKYNET